MEKEIIGYKAPFDMFNKKVKKGTIYLIDENNSNAEFNSCSWTASCEMAYTNLPKEIVETWEPVYKEEEFEIGDWVKWSENALVIAKIHKCNNDNCYTLDVNGDLQSHSNCHKKYLTKATPEEVKEHLDNLLLEEAKKKYPIGTKVIPFNLRFMSGSPSDTIISKDDFYWISDREIWVASGEWNSCIYSKKFGWAEIIPSYPQITINGHVGVFYDNYVQFGCVKISKTLFKDLYQSRALCDIHDFGNKEITAVTIGKGTFTKEQIEEIARHYASKN